MIVCSNEQVGKATVQLREGNVNITKLRPQPMFYPPEPYTSGEKQTLQ